VRYEYVAAGLGVLMALLVFFGLGADFICNLVGFLYPTYASVKAIESKDTADDTQWLVYWVVYGMFTFLETFIDLILYWIPFFYPIKIAFLLWCMHPQTKGATVLYHSFIRDLFKAHEDKIDKMLNEGASAANAAATAATKKDN
jgi:receptor expression-enhancing protein 5/6